MVADDGRQALPEGQGPTHHRGLRGGNSSWTQLWEVAPQELADHPGLRRKICHFLPGTSKWNEIAHRMFCHITQNRRGRPLASYAVMVQFIVHSRTTTGLEIRAELDEHEYPRKEAVTDGQLASVRLSPAKFRSEWNYTGRPH